MADSYYLQQSGDTTNYTSQGVVGGMSTGAEIGGYIGPWGAAIGAGVGALVGYGQGKTNEYAAESDAARAHLQGNSSDKILAQKQAIAAMDKSYDNPSFSHMSGTSTLPMANPQPTQMDEQLRSLGLG